MVVNPKSLVKELNYLHEEGVTTDNLRISDRAHVILPYHIELDRLQEESKGDNKIKTFNRFQCFHSFFKNYTFLFYCFFVKYTIVLET